VEDIMLMQYWHKKIINLEDLIREKNEERTKMRAKVLLAALHRKDTKILLEEIFDQRPEPTMSCDLEPDIHCYRARLTYFNSHEPTNNWEVYFNKEIQQMGGLTSVWFSLPTD